MGEQITNYFFSMMIHLPYANVDVWIPILVFIGFSVGVIGAFLGIGGAWLVTPALNILGFPMAFAVGTDIAHIGAKGILATFFHSRAKNVDYALALLMLSGTVVGIELGAQAVIALERTQNVESVLRWVYVVLLSFISCLIFVESRGVKVVQSWKLPGPYIDFRVSQVRSSIWLPILIGWVSGFLAGFLGIGGGLLRLPMLIYCLGCPTIVAVGTDLFEVMLSGIYGGISYGLKGRVDYMAAMWMFSGAIVGTKIGVIAACRVRDEKIKRRFGFAVFGCLVSVVLKQMGLLVLSKGIIFATIIFLIISILRLLAVPLGSFRKN